MKKILGASVAVAVLVGVSFLSGCASSQSSRSGNLAGVQQNIEKGLPKWVNHDFDYEDASYFLDGYIPSKHGIFASGYGKMGDERSSEIQARLDARANLAARVKSDADRRAAAVNRGSNNSETASSTLQITVESVSQTLEGSQRIDSYTADDGTVYLLFFISDENVKKSLKNAAPEYAEMVDALFTEEMSELQ